jgi:hypothetical protein
LTSVFHLKKDLPAGLYDVRVALVDDEGKPRTRLGIEGADRELRYGVGEILILPLEKVAGCDKADCP